MCFLTNTVSIFLNAKKKDIKRKLNVSQNIYFKINLTKQKDVKINKNITSKGRFLRPNQFLSTYKKKWNNI